MPGRRPAAYLWSQAEHTEGLTGYLVRLLNGGTMAIDQDKLTEFLHKFVGDLGATMAAGNVLVGDRLGFYRVLTGQPMLPHELAERTGTAARYVDEWLRGQAAGGYSLGAQAGEEPDTPARRRRRVHEIPPGGRDALQHRLRGPPVACRPLRCCRMRRLVIPQR